MAKIQEWWEEPQIVEPEWENVDKKSKKKQQQQEIYPHSWVGGTPQRRRGCRNNTPSIPVGWDDRGGSLPLRRRTTIRPLVEALRHLSTNNRQSRRWCGGG